jgi:hypothetical protein
MKSSLLITFLLLAASSANAQKPAVHNGEDVLRAMHDRYENSWYKGVTFTQKSTTYEPDGTKKVETWYEALMLPGKLRIDIGAPSEGNGLVFVDGAVTTVKAGQVTGTTPRVNMLLVLGFDVYGQATEKTIGVVKDQGYDLAKIRDDTWNGHPVYVVGADKGDLNSRQFWVEKDTLLFVREIEPARKDPKIINDIRFVDYRKLAGGWIAARVEVHVGDKLTFSEDYTEIEVKSNLDPAIFDPKQFSSTHWEKQ